MKKTVTKYLSLVALLPMIAAPAIAQTKPAKASAEAHGSMGDDPMMAAMMKAATPGPQHAHLASHAGAWDLTIRSYMDPAAPPMESKGRSMGKMVMGGRYLLEEVSSEAMGGMPAFEGMGMTGYDNVMGEYVGTWVDTMSTGIMTSHGTCNDAFTECTYTGTSSDPMTGKKATSRMVTKAVSADKFTFDMYGPGPDGKEVKMMDITYVRAK